MSARHRILIGIRCLRLNVIDESESEMSEQGDDHDDQKSDEEDPNVQVRGRFFSGHSL
jgi:hypothetical protein